MLQILTGRFFEGTGPIEQRETEAVLFSNWNWVGEVKTPIGVLRRADYGVRGTSCYVFRYMNQFERNGPNGVMMLANSDEAVDQLRALCCLWFRGVFHPKRAFIESLVGTPLQYAQRFFDSSINGVYAETEEFSQFLKELVRLPRSTYVKVMACVQAYCDSIESVHYNFDVAYSLLVYLLEALSKTSESSFVPRWADVEEGQRKKVDEQLQSVDATVANNIREILANNPHLKLFKRFSDFAIANTRDEFFVDEAVGTTWSIRKSELPQLLRNAYATRSGYVHDLQATLEDLRHLAHDAAKETIRFRHNVSLSYAGLLRIARHILITYIRAVPKLDSEQGVDWRSEVPGTHWGELSPELWIHNANSFRVENARQRFSGFALYFMDLLTKPTATMIPLRPLIDVIAELLPTAQLEHKPALISMYWLYNNTIVPEKAIPNWDETLHSIVDADDLCRIEYLTVVTLLHHDLRFDAQICEETYRRYCKGRHKPNAVHLPARLELGVLVFVANKFLAEGSRADHQRLLNEAILDAAGFPAIQQGFRAHAESGTPVSVAELLGQPVAPAESDARTTTTEVAGPHGDPPSAPTSSGEVH